MCARFRCRRMKSPTNCSMKRASRCWMARASAPTAADTCACRLRPHSRASRKTRSASPGWPRGCNREIVQVSQVARAAGRSPSHVTAVVRAQTGMTVLEWITERRMEEARRRLRETDEDVSIVAERVGYEDPAYFALVFRRTHGMSARDFRN